MGRPIDIQRMYRGPARLITYKKNHGPVRPIKLLILGPGRHMAARPMTHGLYMGRPDNYAGRPVDF